MVRGDAPPATGDDIIALGTGEGDIEHVKGLVAEPQFGPDRASKARQRQQDQRRQPARLTVAQRRVDRAPIEQRFQPCYSPSIVQTSMA